MENLKYKSVKIIKRKMTNYNYLINILKKECILNDFKGITGIELYEFIIKKYGNINIKVNNIELKFMTNEIRKYKEKNNLKDNEHNKIINLKSIVIKLHLFIVIIQKKIKIFMNNYLI
jgi:hypothetical protein